MPMSEKHDMQPPSDDRPICAWCKAQPATEAYTLAGHTDMLCAACIIRRQVRDALESRLIHMMTLTRDGRYDEALACLDEIWQANRDRDHDRWLARSVAEQRASLLFEAGRFADAEQALNAQAQL